jgi:RNA polymerase sigma factor (sigma-70 family)
MYNKFVTDQDLKDAMNLASARAYHYQQVGWTMFTREELKSAALEGIAEAIIRFEPTRGSVKDTKFTSYAYFWIEKYLKEYITNNKSMLSASNCEKWQGKVPYVNSYDAYDANDNDGAGSDHKDWLGAGIIASDAMEANERSIACNDLLTSMLLKLDHIERLCMQLSLGIGTLYGKQMEVKQIAKALRISKVQVRLILGNAQNKLKAYKEEYAKQYNNIYAK